jgi:hypothetical protein
MTRKERMRQWFRSHPGYKASKEREYRMKHREEHLAREALRRAVRQGRIERQPCEICGKKSEAHHPDYSEPLNVRWLCGKHHRQLHQGKIKLPC